MDFKEFLKEAAKWAQGISTDSSKPWAAGVFPNPSAQRPKDPVVRRNKANKNPDKPEPESLGKKLRGYASKLKEPGGLQKLKDRFKQYAHSRVSKDSEGKPVFVNQKGEVIKDMDATSRKTKLKSVGAGLAKSIINVGSHAAQEYEDRTLPAHLRLAVKRAANLPTRIDREYPKNKKGDDDEQLAAHTVYDKIGSLLGEDELTDKALVKKRVVKKRVNKAITAEEKEEK